MKNEFFAEVKKVATADLFGNTIIPSLHNDHAIIVTRPDGQDQVVNFVSERYGLLPNSEFFPTLEDAMKNKGFRFDSQYSHIDYCKYYANYIVDGRDLSIGSSKYADKIKPMIKIMKSYSSQIGFRIMFGFYRQICSNGMWGTKWLEQASLKHTEGNMTRMHNQINSLVEKFLDEAQTQAEEFQVIGDREVTNWTDRVMEVAATTSFSTKHVEAVINRINFEHSQNNLPITDWLIYNGFNYQLNHSDAINSAPEARIKVDREIFKHILDKPFDAKFEPQELVLAEHGYI